MATPNGVQLRYPRVLCTVRSVAGLNVERVQGVGMKRIGVREGGEPLPFRQGTARVACCREGKRCREGTVSGPSTELHTRARQGTVQSSYWFSARRHAPACRRRRRDKAPGTYHRIGAPRAR